MPQKALLKNKKIVADFLNVSVRTINRYIQKHKLFVYAHNKDKKIDLRELLMKINANDSRQVGTSLDKFGIFEQKYVNKNKDNTFNKDKKNDWDNLGQVGTKDKISTLEKGKIVFGSFNKTEEQNLQKNFVSSLQKATQEAEIYKKLYEDSVADLKLKQERLEGANYRVGQLEAQIEASVPLLTYRQKEEEMIQLNEIQKKEEAKQKKVIKQLQKEKREVQIVKNTYIIILLSFFFLTPLILIYFLSQ